jgi:NhaP-type Na+/H+ or K+/H+ antiporter
MEKLTILVIAVTVIAFALVSGRLERSPVTLPMAFALVGLLIGPQWLGWIEIPRDSPVLHVLAEVTLILVLFTDAARIDLKLLRREHDLPVRLLLIGLPLTIVLGAAVAVPLFTGLSFWECAVLAAILAPTDAALGQAVVSSSVVPVRIRQALNVESGLNDGIALPVVLFLASFAAMMDSAQGASHWLRFISLQLLLGPLAGIAVGYAGARLIERSARRGWITHSFRDLAVVALSLVAYLTAELIGGNGFIAAFCAGLTLGNLARSLCACLYEFAEAEGQLLSLLIFLLFGIALAPLVLSAATPAMIVYALASLTVIRMLPVALSVAGAGLRWQTTIFLGWFGPRGLASILFALLVLERAGLPGGQVIFDTVLTTVLLSIVLHGASAHWGAARYAAALARAGAPAAAAAPEHRPVTEMPLRLPGSADK